MKIWIIKKIFLKKVLNFSKNNFKITFLCILLQKRNFQWWRFRLFFIPWRKFVLFWQKIKKNFHFTTTSSLQKMKVWEFFCFSCFFSQKIVWFHNFSKKNVLTVELEPEQEDENAPTIPQVTENGSIFFGFKKNIEISNIFTKKHLQTINHLQMFQKVASIIGIYLISFFSISSKK